jgi:6-phosphogluconolactonase
MDAGLGIQPPRLLAGASIHRLADAAAVAEAAARFVVDVARQAILARGAFRIALAGGSTPRATYERLAEPGLAAEVDWARVEVFFGDERMVPPGDTASNYRMACQALLDRVPLAPGGVRRIPGELDPAVAAEQYAAELGDRPLDLVLLGMGDDGHVASLFPGGPELGSGGRRVVRSHSPLPPASRVSLSLGAIDEAGHVAVIVTGAAKAARVAQVFAERASGAPALPAARLAPHEGSLHWFLDAAAASLLDLQPKDPR